jgi:hypothetical protein
MRIAAAAFAVHALLLLVDLVFFDSAYAGNGQHDRFWVGVRIVAVALFAWGLLRGNPRPWLIGLIACFAFLIHDVMRLSDIFAGPPLGLAQRQLTSALFVSLLVGIGASFASSAREL